MKDFNPDNEKHMEIVQETEQAMKEEAERQMEEIPRLANGRPDFMTMIEEMFPGQIGVASYVKGICKGYAFQMSMQSIENLLKETEKGITQLKMSEVIPEEIRPDNKDVKVTSNDIN